MSYKDIKIQKSYISCGDDNIATAFVTPMLKQAKVYKRSVGYFSSGVFETITDGIVSLARNGGNIRLIASPKLSEDDIEAIKLGYEKKEHVAANAFTDMFLSELEEMKDANLSLLVDLIANDILDIKIAVANSIGDYHDKLGVFIDENDNKVAFFGSSNSSVNGYKNNYEKIRTARSWVEGEDLRVKDEEEEFDSLWNGSNPYVSTYDYKESARKNVLEVIDRRVQRKRASSAIKLRDYQEEAIAAWKANNYKGFYVMATGTGKTWTAIFSAKELLKEHTRNIGQLPIDPLTYEENKSNTIKIPIPDYANYDTVNIQKELAESIRPYIDDMYEGENEALSDAEHVSDGDIITTDEGVFRVEQDTRRIIVAGPNYKMVNVLDELDTQSAKNAQEPSDTPEESEKISETDETEQILEAEHILETEQAAAVETANAVTDSNEAIEN